MSDDVRRVLPNQLRGMGGCEPGCGCILCDAASEIERLSAALQEIIDSIEICADMYTAEGAKEIARHALGVSDE